MSKKPIIYLALLSQPCRSVLMTCADLGIEIEQRLVDLHNAEHLTPEYLKVCVILIEKLHFFTSNNEIVTYSLRSKIYVDQSTAYDSIA